MRTTGIRISGLLAPTLIGGFMGSTFDTVCGHERGSIAGTLAGLLAFICARL